MKKRTLSIALVFILMFTLIPLTTSTANPSVQTDVEVGYSFADGGEFGVIVV